MFPRLLPPRLGLRRNGDQHCEAGFSLISALVGIGIGCLVAVVVSKAVTDGMKGQKSVELRGDLAAAKSLLVQYVDCGAVFTKRPDGGAEIDPAAPGSACDSTGDAQVAPYLKLYRQTRNSGPKELGTWDSTCKVMRLGAFAFRTTCSASDESLIVKAARLDKDCKPLVDPLTGRKMGFDSPRSDIIGGKGMPMCFPGVQPVQMHKFSLSVTPAGFAQTMTAPCEGTNICAGPLNVSFGDSSAPLGEGGWPTLVAPSKGVVILDIKGHSNWDGGSIIEFTNLTARIMTRKNGGAFEFAAGGAQVIHNGGGPFTASTFIRVSAGDKIEVAPQFLFQQAPYFAYSIGQPGTWLYITAWSVYGTLTMTYEPVY